MRQPTLDDVVSVNKDYPELGVKKDDRGTITAMYFAPEYAYEIRMHREGPIPGRHSRILLLGTQITVLTKEGAVAV